jgi:hypothetical protein
MIKLRSLPLYVLASVSLIPAFAQAQGVASAARILNRIDESQLVSLKGNTHPFANARHDQGKVADDLPMTDLILVLSRSAQQQAAFDAYVASEYDPNSPNFHKWLTADQIGEDFGPSQTDILTITNWLTGHGLSVSEVTRDRMSIRFGGTAAQVEGTFHTEIHNLSVNGAPHIGNMSDPEIPSALAPVVVGVKSLHNFFPKPLHRKGQIVARDASSGQWARPAAVGAVSQTGADSTRPLLGAGQASRAPLPLFGINASSSGYPYLVEDVGPWDFATIYNIAPLWSAGIDGTGQTIAIAGTSAIDLGETNITGANGNDDVRTFRTFFNLPTTNPSNTPIQVSGNSQPLQVCTSTSSTALCGIDDLLENSLDVEWSGSVAKNAQIVLVASYPASASDDNLYDSESYIVDNVGNPNSPVYGVHVMNVSYGNCELAMGTGGNVQYYDLWQTAAAEGLAVFVASGDSGSASCDDGGYVAESGLTVSGIASTPFDTAVGGTDFNWCAPQNFFNSPSTECTASPYWNTSNSSTNQSSAKNYVPEVPWNDTCANPLALTWEQDMASEIFSIPAADVSSPEQACNFIYDYSYTGNAISGFGLGYYYPYGEDLVEVVGGSGGVSSCVVNTTNPAGTTLGSCTATTGAGSTGVSSNPDTGASQASVATYNNGWPAPSWQTGSGVPGTSGLTTRAVPDVSFFAADGFLSSSAYLVCVSQDTSVDGVTYQPCSYSNSVEPFAEEVGGTSVATPAMAGIMALINQKTGAAQGSPNQALYALAAKQTWSSTCSAENATTSDGCYFNDIDKGTNAMPCDYDDGSPNCVATQSTLGYSDQVGILSGYSAGTGYDEATGLGSLNVANVVNAWTAVTPGSAAPAVTVTPNAASINTDNLLEVTVTVAGAAGAPQTPTGYTVPPTGTVTLTANGASFSASGSLNSSGMVTLIVPANTLPGSAAGQLDTLTASYAGDVNYAAKTGTGQVTVSNATPLTPTITVTPSQSGSTISVTVSVTGSGATPTGFITLSAASGSYQATTQTIGVSPCASASSCVFTMQASLFTGTVTVTAQYSGDIHYAAGQNTGQVTGATFRLAPGTPSSSSVTPGSSATVQVTASAVNGYDGIVTLSCAQTSTTATGSDGTTCTGSGTSQVNLATCGTSCSVTFTIGTTAPTAAAMARPKLPGGNNKGPGGELLGAGSGAVLALLVFFGIPARRRSWRNMLSVLIALAAIGVMTGCGGGSSGGGGGGQGDPGTTAGTYTYTVTASSNPSVTPSVTTTFTVTVN